MRYHEFKIVEALKPSEYRSLVKGWDRNRYKQIFLNPKYKHDRNGYRIYIPIPEKSQATNTQNPAYQEIEAFLSQNGYHMIDYAKGLVQNLKNKQQIKIGRVLTKLKREDLLHKFNTDKNRAGTQSVYMVVISRHPYDLSGMSTDRGWTSCMNLTNGPHRHYVPIDIKEGSVIAYVTTYNDVDLKNPTGRVLLKPFVDVFGKPVVYFGIENQVYGTNVPGFLEIVNQWTSEVNNAGILDDVVILQFKPGLYRDSDLADQTLIRGKNITPEIKAQIQQIQDSPTLILKMDNPSEVLQLAAVSKRPGVFVNLMNQEGYIPPESVQRLAVAKDYELLENILQAGITPSESVQLAAVGANWRSIYRLLDKNVDIPESVAEIAIERNPRVIGDLHKKSYKFTKTMLIKGLRSNGSMIDWYIKNDLPVDTDIEVAAFENGYDNFYRIFLKYREKNQQMPVVVMNAIVNGRYAGKIVAEILNHNSNSSQQEQIPIQEKQIVRAMITDTKGLTDWSLYNILMDDYPDVITEKSWIEYLTKTRPVEFKVNRLKNRDLISNDGIKQLLPYNGDLISFVEDPSEEDIYNAIKNSPTAISNINNPSVELQIFAVRKDPNTIGYIDRPALAVFKAAATFKKNIDEDPLNVYTFLHVLVRSIDDNDVLEEDAKKLLKLLINTRPERIVPLTEFGGFGPDEELQMLAVEHVPSMVLRLLQNDIAPSDRVFLAHVRHHGLRDFSRIIDHVSYVNRKNIKVVVPEQMFEIVLQRNMDVDTVIRAMNQLKIPVSKDLIKKILERSPKNIIALLSSDLDVTPQQVFDAANTGKLNEDPNTFLSAVQKKFGNVPEQLVIVMLKNSSNKKGEAVNLYLSIEHWAETNSPQLLTDPVHKAALAADYKNILLINNPSQELRDLNYELNGYWSPIGVGDMVRVTNTRATPGFKVVALTKNGYRLKRDDQDRGEFSRERIHRVNGIELPKDYEQKQKLFAEKWPLDAAMQQIKKVIKNNEILRTQLSDIVRQYQLDDDQRDEITKMLEYRNVDIVSEYTPTRQEFDI